MVLDTKATYPLQAPSPLLKKQKTTTTEKNQTNHHGPDEADVSSRALLNDIPHGSGPIFCIWILMLS